MASNTEIDPELEREYNVSLLRADFPATVEDWVTRSEAFRDIADAQLNLAYGEGEGERVDLFSCGNKHAPC